MPQSSKSHNDLACCNLAFFQTDVVRYLVDLSDKPYNSMGEDDQQAMQTTHIHLQLCKQCFKGYQRLKFDIFNQDNELDRRLSQRILAENEAYLRVIL